MPALSDKNQIELSVVVATYNRGGYILDTLLSLAAQTLPGPKWELLVVNNNSTDDTEAIVEQFARENPGINVRHVVELQQGVSYARTRGVTDSRGGYIVYVDDDELVNDRFLEVFYDFLEARPEVGAAGGRTIARYTESVPRWMSPFTERPIACIVDHGSLPRPFPPGRFFGGGNMALRRTMFDKYGLFDTGLGRVRRGLMAGE